MLYRPPSCIIKRTVGCEASMNVQTRREAIRGVQPRGTSISNNTPEQWKQWTTCRQLSTDFPSHEYYYQLRVSQCYHITCRRPWWWYYASLARTIWECDATRRDGDYPQVVPTASLRYRDRQTRIHKQYLYKYLSTRANERSSDPRVVIIPPLMKTTRRLHWNRRLVFLILFSLFV